MKRGYLTGAKCPYYKRETAQSVVCDGIKANTSIHVTFGTRTECKEHKNEFCKRKDFEKCPIYKLTRKTD